MHLSFTADQTNSLLRQWITGEVSDKEGEQDEDLPRPRVELPPFPELRPIPEGLDRVELPPCPEGLGLTQVPGGLRLRIQRPGSEAGGKDGSIGGASGDGPAETASRTQVSRRIETLGLCQIIRE